MKRRALLARQLEIKPLTRAREPLSIETRNEDNVTSILRMRQERRSRIVHITISNEMEQIWKVIAEVLVEPGDLPSGDTKGFLIVTTWADSLETARQKLSRYLESYKWHLISIEDAHPIDETLDYGEEIDDMIARTVRDGNAIILGTFHSYKED
jgi:hypothetical protein